MPIGAAIGAIGSIASAGIGYLGSKNAQNTLQNMQNNALNIAQGALNPFINAGSGVLSTLQSLLTPGASQTATLSQTPGFQFANQYGQIAATNALAARGQGASAGPVASGLAQYSSGLASQTWQSVVNALQNFGSMGAQAAGSLAGTAANTISNFASPIAGSIMGGANALAGGVAGAGNNITNALLLGRLLPNAGIYKGGNQADSGISPPSPDSG